MFSYFLAMMLSQQGPTAADRLVPLVTADGQTCTGDRSWCVSLSAPQDEGEQTLPIVRAGPTATPPPPREETFSDQTYAAWPNLILLKDGSFLAGIEARTSTGYSGGGGSATELRLFRIAPDGQAAATPVLRVPIGAFLMIRACFNEHDMKARRGACHDEYSFAGSIALAPDAASGLPALAYVSEANVFPRGVSRMEDSTGKARLKKSDLVRERDPKCSIARRFRFDAATGTYQPDTPLPDCSDYTIP
jgi:hypothetical protein